MVIQLIQGREVPNRFGSNRFGGLFRDLFGIRVPTTYEDTHEENPIHNILSSLGPSMINYTESLQVSEQAMCHVGNNFYITISKYISNGPCNNIESGDHEPLWMVPFERNNKFIGRQRMLSMLLKIVPPSGNLYECQRVAIEGIGGVGKTRIAFEMACRMKEGEEHCDIFWVPALDIHSFKASFRNIGVQLKVQDIDNETKNNTDFMWRVKAALEARRKSWLLVVDNADDTALFCDGSYKNGDFGPPLKEYLPESQHGSILFTTRNHRLAQKLGIREEHCIRLAAMEISEAIKLFRALVDGHPGDGMMVNQLVSSLTCLPLAIKQAAAYIRQTGTPLDKYVGMLQSSDAQLVRLLSEDFVDKTHRYCGMQENAVAMTLLYSYREILAANELAAACLVIMSFCYENTPMWFPPPKGKYSRSSLAMEEALDLLKAYNFITEEACINGRLFMMHRLVRLAVQNLEDKAMIEDCRAAVIKHMKTHIPSTSAPSITSLLHHTQQVHLWP